MTLFIKVIVVGSKTPQHLIDACRKLRIENRLSLNEIADRVGLKKSTAQIYLKDIPLTLEERNARRTEALTASNERMGPEGRSARAKKAGEASHTEQAAAKRRESRSERLVRLGFDGVGYDHKRFLIISEQNGTCNHCGLSEWRGQPICLEIDHKNGDNRDHRRENMEAICPNCHAMTDTWRGRNKKSAKMVTDEELIRALETTKNIRQALLQVGLAAKGGNYRRAARIKEERKL